MIESSEYFQTLFESKFKENLHQQTEIPVISIENCDPKDFKKILAYLYSGSVVLNQKNILAMAFLAERFGADQLKERCLDSLPDFFFPYQAVSLYFQSVLDTPSSLTSLIEKYFYENLFLICQEYPHTLHDLSEEKLLVLIKKAPFENKKDLIKVVWIWLIQAKELCKRTPFFLESVWPLFPQNEQALCDYVPFLAQLLSSSHQQFHFEQECVDVSKDIFLRNLHEKVLIHFKTSSPLNSQFEAKELGNFIKTACYFILLCLI